MKLAELIARKKEQILEVAQKYGAKNIRLFGSAASGDDRSDSDVDLLVDMDPERGLFDLGELKMDLEELLNRKVDVVTESSLYWLIKRKILKEARPL
jgi:predicted nucleotidyltransferase